jgi:hypothetical protein
MSVEGARPAKAATSSVADLPRAMGRTGPDLSKEADTASVDGSPQLIGQPRATPLHSNHQVAKRWRELWSANWWQGAAGLAQIVAALLAIATIRQVASVNEEADRLRRESARPRWMVSSHEKFENEHGRGFRWGLVNAGGQTVTVLDVGFRVAFKGCWVVQRAFPYAVPVGASTALIVTCADNIALQREVLLVAQTQPGEITVHSIAVSVDTLPRPGNVVGGGIGGKGLGAEVDLIAVAPARHDVEFPRPVGNVAP